MTQTILELTDLSKQYGQNWAVKQLNLKLTPGEIYGFLGRNGAGKTTTIRMIMGLIRPTAGQIKFCGQDTKALGPSLFNRVAATIEYPGFYPNLTAQENLLYYAKMHNIPTRKVKESLTFFGLKESAHRLTKEFSLGMKQRLGLARAMLNEPELLILDEPTNGLDPAGIHEIRDTIKALNLEHGITILFSSHILSEVEQISSKIGIIHEGVLAEEFTLTDFNNSVEPVLQVGVSDPQRSLELLYKANISASVYDNNRLHLTGVAPEFVNRLLVEQGVDVFQLYTYKESLEDRFLRLTGGEK